MSGFQVGDKVEVMKTFGTFPKLGQIGIITKIEEDLVYLDNDHKSGNYTLDLYIKLIKKGDTMSKFQVGDEVEAVENHTAYYGIKKGTKGIITHMGWQSCYGCSDAIWLNNEQEGGRWWLEKQLKLIKRGGNKMSKYEDLKRRINALDNGWTKTADDIMQEIWKAPSDDLQLYWLLIGNEANSSIRIIKSPYNDNIEEDKVADFRYKNQCEKLKAFKNALLWLLDHSDISKDLVGQEIKADVEGKTYRVKILREE